jgi:hypothetical protein
MFLLAAGFTMPVFLVFGLYHLLTWFNLLNISSRVFWKRIALTSAISHVILAVGFFIVSYVDYTMNLQTALVGLGFDGYLFNRSEFWRVMTIFDTAPMLALLGIFGTLDKLGINPPLLVAGTMAVTLLVGTVQWYFVGGGIGLLLERFWSGLKSNDETDQDWL